MEAEEKRGLTTGELGGGVSFSFSLFFFFFSAVTTASPPDRGGTGEFVIARGRGSGGIVTNPVQQCFSRDERVRQ